MPNNRGSIWRRWDLHIHTPGTKKNDQFTGRTIEEKWEKYYEDISKYIGDGKTPEKTVAAIGITDYLSIENYQKVIADRRLPKSVGLVLPNVEIRIQPIAHDSPVNMHFIFDPAVVDSLESRFFSNLRFQLAGTTFSATKSELIRLGKKMDPGLDNAAAYLTGIHNFVPSFNDVVKLFEQDADLRESTLVGVSNSSSDGVSGVIQQNGYGERAQSQLEGVKRSIYQFANFIFSGKPSDRAYFLGEKSDSIWEVIRKYGSVKPCLHGCDAHENARIFEPAETRYCWVKADLSFNGLRQVLFEPKDRVRISPIMPETKADYQVIDSVVIKDKGFSPCPILFNDKLNCIIGGKSTGKSILLHNIARTIDTDQAETKIKDAANKTYNVEQMEVYWGDGAVDSGSTKSNHKIVYIPQTYLNRLSDKTEEKTEIDSIIEKIVLDDSATHNASIDLAKNVKIIKTNTDKQIFGLSENYSSLKQLKEQAKELGTRSGIEKEIKKIKQQKNKLSQENSLTVVEIEQYEKAKKALHDLKADEARLQASQSDIEKTDSIVELAHPDFTGDETILEALREAEQTVKRAADKEWQKQKVILSEKIKERKAAIAKARAESEAIYSLYHESVESNETLKQLSEQLTKEELRLSQFQQLERTIDKVEKEVDSQLKTLSTMLSVIESEYGQYASIVNSNAPNGELQFSVTYPFKVTAFTERLKNIFDNRTLKAKNDIIDLEDFDYSSFSPEKVKRLLSACLYEELPLVRGYNVESAFRTILDDWFNVSYNVTMDGDKIEEMSPGKKALVLLRLLLNLADSKSPILIDQPEDDLDNRSITNDLIQFIKQKKIERQIIVVTHNANVVLGGDAEEVIVANRDGINSPNETFRFEYRTGAIEENEPVVDENGNTRKGVLNQVGISQHICSILEGGEEAFNLRKSKYRI